jgi:hypothetical protein
VPTPDKESFVSDVYLLIPVRLLPSRTCSGQIISIFCLRPIIQCGTSSLSHTHPYLHTSLSFILPNFFLCLPITALEPRDSSCRRRPLLLPLTSKCLPSPLPQFPIGEKPFRPCAASPPGAPGGKEVPSGGE